MRGSLREKTPGRWELRVPVGLREDPRRSRIVRGDEAHAQAVLDGWVAAIEAERDVRTLRALLDEWYAHTEIRRRPRGNDAVRNHLRRVKDDIGDWSIDEITAVDLERYYRRLRKDKVGEPTIRKVHYVIRPALRYAARLGWITVNPALVVELEPAPKSKVKPPDPEVATKLLQAAAERRPLLALFMWLLVVTGARRGEIAGLRWGSVDWETGMVRIDGNLYESEGKVDLGDPKTDRSNRSTEVDAITLALLEEHRRQLETRGATLTPGRYVFPDSGPRTASKALRKLGVPDTRRPIRPGTWTHWYAELRDGLGIVGVRLHDLRHLHASVLLNTPGFELIHVSAQLGHSRTSTTTDVYGHLLPRRGLGAAAVVAGALRG